MNVYEHLVILNDDWVRRTTTRQIDDEGSRYFGGIIDAATKVAWPNHTTTVPGIESWVSALVNPDSAFYRSYELLERLEKALRFMLTSQHEDGTISPGWTNYHSPPDTAFVIVGLAQAMELIEMAQWPALGEAYGTLRKFLERSVPAMLTGGCHTPNHRWVLTAALAFLYREFGLEELKDRAEEWLAEGMDCTADGEWTERSNGIYNTVSDIMLCHAARLLDKPELLEPVRRNLRMMIYLVHPDGEIVTDYSGRQDFGQRSTLAYYYLPFRMMADIDGDPEFAAMADWAKEALSRIEEAPNHAIVGYLLNPHWREADEQAPQHALPESYRIIINGQESREQWLATLADAPQAQLTHSRLHTEFASPIVRIREGRTSVTIMTEAPSFFSMRHGSARLLGLQLVSTFDPGTIRMSGLSSFDNAFVNEGYKLVSVGEKGYYGPVPGNRLPASASKDISPWYLLPHAERPVTHLQKQSMTIEAEETCEGWTLRLRSEGPSDVLTQVVFVLGEEGNLAGDRLEWSNDRIAFWEGGTVRYGTGEDWIELDGGASEHGAAEIRNHFYPTGCKLLIVNLITPIQRTFSFRLSPR